MEIDNKTVIIMGVLVMGYIALYMKYNDLALAVVSGLLGYLTKETIDLIEDSKKKK